MVGVREEEVETEEEGMGSRGEGGCGEGLTKDATRPWIEHEFIEF
jgi:hypothetical protein